MNDKWPVINCQSSINSVPDICNSTQESSSVLPHINSKRKIHLNNENKLNLFGYGRICSVTPGNPANSLLIIKILIVNVF